MADEPDCYIENVWNEGPIGLCQTHDRTAAECENVKAQAELTRLRAELESANTQWDMANRRAAKATELRHAAESEVAALKAERDAAQQMNLEAQEAFDERRNSD